MNLVSNSAARFEPNSENALPKRSASQHFVEQQPLLGLVGGGANGGDYAKMILRNLPERRIGCGDDRDDLRDRDVGNFRAAKFLRHVDGPKAALRKEIKLFDRPPTEMVAIRGARRESLRKALGDFDRLGVRCNDVRGFSWTDNARFTFAGNLRLQRFGFRVGGSWFCFLGG